MMMMMRVDDELRQTRSAPTRTDTFICRERASRGQCSPTDLAALQTPSLPSPSLSPCLACSPYMSIVVTVCDGWLLSLAWTDLCAGSSCCSSVNQRGRRSRVLLRHACGCSAQAAPCTRAHGAWRARRERRRQRLSRASNHRRFLRSLTTRRELSQRRGCMCTTSWCRD